MTCRLALVVLAAAFLVGCGSGKSSGPTVVIAVDAPFSRDPYVATTIANGVRLAAANLGVERGDVVNFRVVTYDNAGSPSRAVADVRRAVGQHAVAIVTDGTGVDATWKLAAAAHVPLGIVYDGNETLVDPAKRPNVFRVAPTNHGMAFRFAEYLIPKRLKLGLLTDDTGYGIAGRAALDRAFAQNRSSVVARVQVPSTASDLAPQILQARQAGATALIVWGQPPAIAEAVVAARSAGWRVPIYAPPAAQDPFVRQELAGQPQWLEGLTFASGRLTAEGGVGPWYSFENNYEAMFGAQKVGVKTPQGLPVIQPPEFAMYAFDFTNLLAVAVDRAGKADGARVIAALNQVSAPGANGDSRGFNENSHEGVVDDDIYFARFAGEVFRPVADDALSRTLPALVQHP
jgi:ABC-type branched-subunit amino acid transport system substrate-binding protein